MRRLDPNSPANPAPPDYFFLEVVVKLVELVDGVARAVVAPVDVAQEQVLEGLAQEVQEVERVWRDSLCQWNTSLTSQWSTGHLCR